MCAHCVVRSSRTVVRRCLCRSSSVKPMCACCVAFITGEGGGRMGGRKQSRRSGEGGLIFPPRLFRPPSLDQTWRHSSDFFVLVPLPADAGGERIGRRSSFHIFLLACLTLPIPLKRRKVVLDPTVFCIAAVQTHCLSRVSTLPKRVLQKEEEEGGDPWRVA